MSAVAEHEPQMREKVLALEREVQRLPQVDLQTTHVLSGGIYARTVHIPAGAVVTGATHKKDHVCVIQGDITALTEDGPVRFTGHHVIAAKAGIKRAVVAHAPTTWTTLCRTELADLHEIEAELVEEHEQLQTRTLELAGQQTQKLEG